MPARDTDYVQAEQWVAACLRGRRLRACTRKALASGTWTPGFNTTGWYVWAEPRDSSSAWHFGFRYGDEHWGGRSCSTNDWVFGVRSRARR